MVSRTPPALPYRPDCIPPEILSSFKQRSHDRHHTRFGENPMHLRNLQSVASPPKDNVTKTTPLSGGTFYPCVGLAVIDPLAKFRQCSFIHSRNIEGGLKFQKRLRDRDHGPFRWGGIFLPPGLDLP